MKYIRYVSFFIERYLCAPQIEFAPRNVPQMEYAPRNVPQIEYCNILDMYHFLSNDIRVQESENQFEKLPEIKENNAKEKFGFRKEIRNIE